MSISRAEATADLNLHLTEVIGSIRPSQFNLINDVVAPPLVKEGIHTGQFEIRSTTYLEESETAWANGETANKVRTDKPSLVEFTTERHAKEICITEHTLSQREQAGVKRDDHIQEQVEELYFNLLLQKELKLASLLNTTGNYTSSDLYTTLGTTWTAAGGTPVSDIEDAMAALVGKAYPGTLFAADELVKIRMQRHAALVSFGSPDKRRMVGDDEFRAIFGDLRFVFSNSRYITGGALTPVWQDSAIILHQSAASGNREGPPAAMRTIVSQAPIVEEWWDSSVKGTWYRVSEQYVHQATAVDSSGKYTGAYLIDNAI